MISEKQLQANRQNAQKSTGPRTAEGKAASSQNAVTHGLLSRRVVIAGEDRLQFEAFRNELFEQLAPVGIIESQLTDQIAANFWRLRRAGSVEVSLIDSIVDGFRKFADKHQEEYLLNTYNWFIRTSDSILPFDDFEQTQDAWLQTEEGQTYRAKQNPRADNGRALIRAFTDFLRRSAQSSRPPANGPEQGGSPSEADKPENPLGANISLQEEQNEQECLETGLALADDFKGHNVMLKFRRYEAHIERSVYKALAELQRLQTIRIRNEAIWLSSQETESS